MKKKKTIIRSILIVLIILWAILIFSMSNQQGSESSGLSRRITTWFFREEQIDIVEPYIRKIAHFGEYTIGGMLFMSLFLTYEWTENKQITISILLGIWYSILDEIHQIFIPNRSGNIKDVWIDTLGISFGVCLILLFYKLYKKYRKKKEGI